ncbi:helix-turn-helix domain-containing protein [Nocardioides sp. TF02-7]|uniref:helix-turn-helix transcriptional regulator n=1 Tax=Nocardioides sp. TF02-7 TaxID=2917724 RepID=UPI001F063707|nr:helix-turn-helix domain-containing protein [Nocardioides sp. TF02-7]UMG94386.1 helix-turn-helix domain-containing protein [Nocardioides sp. TF02-7]
MDDVAAFLGVPKKTIYSWRTAGKGPKGFRVGKYLRWHPRTVHEWSLRQEDDQ